MTPPDQYADEDTSPTECDVANKADLTAYRDLRARAFALLRTDEEHSVWAQIIEFNWLDATFRIINEARRNATGAHPNAAIAPLLGEFVDQAYVMGVVGAVGRLTDPPSEDAVRGVVSLPTVLRMLRDNLTLFRREIFVSHDGVPYDPTAPAEVWEPGVRWVAHGPHDISADRHALFDRLSRKTPDKRSRSDVVHFRVLAGLEDRLAHPSIIKIRRHRNKVVSHAADATARAGIGKLGLSLADVDDTARALIEITEVLATILTGEILVGSPIPIAQFDVLEHLGEPFAFQSDLTDLQSLWDETVRMREGWSDDALRNVLGR